MKNTVAYFIWTFVCLFSLHSCIGEEVMSDIGEDAYINLVFTRSVALPTPGEDSEAGVHSLRVFVYNTAGALEFTQKYASGAGPIENPIIKVKAGVKAVYAIVNEEASGVDATDLSGKLAAVSTLGTSSSAELEALLVKYNSYPLTSATGLLMTGFVENVTVDEGRTRNNPQKVEIEVVRNCARLDLKIQKSENVASGTVVLQKIEFGNGCNLQTLFESDAASANPAEATYDLSYTPYESSAGITITHSQSATIGDALQDIGTYYLPENLGNYTDDAHGNAEFIQLTYMVNGSPKTSRIDLNPTDISAKHYNIIRNTRYELAITIDAQKPGFTLNILDWDEQPIQGDIQGAYLSVPGKVVMDRWNLGKKFDTSINYTSNCTVSFVEYGVSTNMGATDWEWTNDGSNLPNWLPLRNITGLPDGTTTSGSIGLKYEIANAKTYMPMPIVGDYYHPECKLRIRAGNITKEIHIVYDNGYIPNDLLKVAGWTESTLPKNGVQIAKRGNVGPSSEATEEVKMQLVTTSERESLAAIAENIATRDYTHDELLAQNPKFGNGSSSTDYLESRGDSPAANSCRAIGKEWYLPSVGESEATMAYHVLKFGPSYKFDVSLGEDISFFTSTSPQSSPNLAFYIHFVWFARATHIYPHSVSDSYCVRGMTEF